MPPADFTPTLADLGAMMRARTRDASGVELGTFTADTRPTAAEATVAITRALGLVAPRLGTVPSSLYELAKGIVALRAAMLVETSYVPEETGPDTSAYAAYREQYRDALADYESAPRDAAADRASSRTASVPMGFLAAWERAQQP